MSEALWALPAGTPQNCDCVMGRHDDQQQVLHIFRPVPGSGRPILGSGSIPGVLGTWRVWWVRYRGTWNSGCGAAEAEQWETPRQELQELRRKALPVPFRLCSLLLALSRLRFTWWRRDLEVCGVTAALPPDFSLTTAKNEGSFGEVAQSRHQIHWVKTFLEGLQ